MILFIELPCRSLADICTYDSAMRNPTRRSPRTLAPKPRYLLCKLPPVRMLTRVAEPSSILQPSILAYCSSLDGVLFSAVLRV